MLKKGESPLVAVVFLDNFHGPELENGLTAGFRR
jgi:hypothetical protein